MLPLMKTILVPDRGNCKAQGLLDVMVRKELFHWEAWEGDQQGCEGRVLPVCSTWNGFPKPWKGSSCEQLFPKPPPWGLL